MGVHLRPYEIALSHLSYDFLQFLLLLHLYVAKHLKTPLASHETGVGATAFGFNSTYEGTFLWNLAQLCFLLFSR
jgi:hypothetical protein